MQVLLASPSSGLTPGSVVDPEGAAPGEDRNQSPIYKSIAGSEGEEADPSGRLRHLLIRSVSLLFPLGGGSDEDASKKEAIYEAPPGLVRMQQQQQQQQQQQKQQQGKGEFRGFFFTDEA